MKNIKAILFDLDGTLRHHIPNGGDVFVDYVRSLGIKVSEEDRVRAEHWTHHYFAYSLEIQADGKAFSRNGKDFWANYTKRRLIALGLPRSRAVELAPQVSAYMGENYRPAGVVPEDVYPLLQKLRAKGVTLGVVSNRDEPYAEEIKEIGMDSFFSFSLAGGEIGHYKPEREIFERALTMSGTAAQETMYVGDNYFADVIGSRRAGLVPVLYDPISLFPEPDCTVVKSFAQLQGLLGL